MIDPDAYLNPAETWDQYPEPEVEQELIDKPRPDFLRRAKSRAARIQLRALGRVNGRQDWDQCDDDWDEIEAARKLADAWSEARMVTAARAMLRRHREKEGSRSTICRIPEGV